MQPSHPHPSSLALDDAPARIVVLGGGYAGVLAANRLKGRLGERAQVTLIEEREDLVHRVRLHEVIASGPGKRHPLSELLHRNVRHLLGRATRIDAAARHVEVGETREPFDHLIIAVGSGPRDAIPGALSHGGALHDTETALAAHQRIAGLSKVVVIGGGLTGVEVATELACRRPDLDVVLLASSILPQIGQGARAYAESVLSQLGIERATGRAISIDDAGVALEGGGRIDSDMVIWAGGFSPKGPAIECDLARDAEGRFLVDQGLCSVNHDRVWIAGDAAAPPPGMPFARMSCALAMPMGAHAADNVIRAVRHQARVPFRFGYAGQCVSLGRKRAVMQLVTPGDQPRAGFLSGTTAALVKELICTYVIGALRVERLFGGAYTWQRSLEARRDDQDGQSPLASLPVA